RVGFLSSVIRQKGLVTCVPQSLHDRWDLSSCAPFDRYPAGGQVKARANYGEKMKQAAFCRGAAGTAARLFNRKACLQHTVAQIAAGQDYFFGRWRAAAGPKRQACFDPRRAAAHRATSGPATAL